MGRHNPYQERLTELTIDELLEEMDDYGIAHYMIHEAAKRIRSLIASQQSDPADQEEQAAYDADCDQYNRTGWSPSHGGG